MLQKLLIALCTVFVLSACGGDLDLEPDNIPPTYDGGDDGDDEDEFEPGEPQAWVNEDFSAAESTESWMQRCADGCNASAALSWNESEEVLVVEPEWASDADALEIYSPIEEIEDMNGAHVGLWVYITDAYLEDGNLQMSLFLENAAGGSAITRGYPIENAGWNKLAIWEIAAGDPNAEPEAPAEGEEEPTADYGTFDWHSDGFTLTDINTVGVRLSANGKPVSADGPLWLDNLIMSAGSDFAPTLLDITEGWFSKGAYDVDGDVAADPVYGDGFVSLTVDKASQQLVYPVEEVTNYSGADIIFTLSFDQAYVDSASGFQPFGQVYNDTAENYLDDKEVGGEWDCWTGLGDVTVDEEIEVSCTLDQGGIFELTEDQYLLLGVQSQGNTAAGTIRVHEVEIKGLQRDTGPFEIIPTAASVEGDAAKWTNDNYNNVEGAADLTYSADDAAMVIAPNWQATDSEERIIMYVAEEGELPELGGATATVELYLPEYYTATNPGMELQIYTQQNGGEDGNSYDGTYGGYITLDSGEDLGDGWWAFSRTFPSTEVPELSLRVGIKLQRRNGWTTDGEPGPDILLRKMIIE